MVHRDIKPANIVIKNGKDIKLKFVDFGATGKTGADPEEVGTFFPLDLLLNPKLKPCYSADDAYGLGFTLLVMLSLAYPDENGWTFYRFYSTYLRSHIDKYVKKTNNGGYRLPIAKICLWCTYWDWSTILALETL